ncbi:hypothetical protein FBU30_005125 [Linnemannia zychae]|nr:hypothetical protein FBU30_005125 [Linnemannia zychae]
MDDPITHFQAFHAPGEKEPILIPAVLHPTLNELYVIWSDIADCFPRMTRIQYSNMFVPKMRDERLYKVKPFGIRYHPGIVLRIVYGEQPPKRISKKTKDNINCTKLSQTMDRLSSGAMSDPDVPTVDRVQNKEDGGDGHGYVEDILRLTLEKLRQEQKYQFELGQIHKEDLEQGQIQKQTREQSREQKQEQIQEQTQEQSQSQIQEYIQEQIRAQTQEQGHEKEQAQTQESEQVQVHEQAQESEQDQSQELMQEQEHEQQHEQDQEYSADIRDSIPTVQELVQHRVQNIIHCQRSWKQSGNHSRLFCYLPVLKDIPPSSLSTEETKGTTLTHLIAKIDSKTMFRFYCLCHCGDLPDATGNIPRSHWLESSSDSCIIQDIDQLQLRQLIPLLGDYIMGILEMLKYGVYIDKIPEVTAQRVSLAIDYFESKGVQSCKGFMKEISEGRVSFTGRSILNNVPLIEALSEKPLIGFKKESVKKRENYKDYAGLRPYRALEGDIRWMCAQHWYGVLAEKELCASAMAFCNDPMSAEGWYMEPYGLWSSRILSMLRARQYFELARKLTWNPVFTVWLDFKMDLEDEIELAQAISHLSAAVLNIAVLPREKKPGEIETGFAGGYIPLIDAALRNPNIETFTLTRQASKSASKYDLSVNPIYSELYGPRSHDYLMRLTREVKGTKAKAMLRVTNSSFADQILREWVSSFRYLVELRLELESNPEEHLTITLTNFSWNEADDNNNEDEANICSRNMFFKEQQEHNGYNVAIDHDKKKCLNMGMLTHAVLEVSLQDDPLMQNLLKQNKFLKSLTLKTNDSDYDPSQFFETHKGLIQGLLCMEALTIRSKATEGCSPTFTWRNPTNPERMRVDLNCSQNVNVEMMFQRYAPLIERLEVSSISLKDATAMMKAMQRKKKKALSPKYISIKDIHMMEPSVREILREAINLGVIEEVVVHGSVIPQPDQSSITKSEDEAMARVKLDVNIKIWTDFLVATRSKLSKLFVQDSYHRRFLRAMEQQPSMSPEMPWLRAFHYSSGISSESSLFGRPWLKTLLKSKGPISTDMDTSSSNGQNDNFSRDMFTRRNDIPNLRALVDIKITGMSITPEDWKLLLKYFYFSQMSKFEIQQTNSLSKQTLLVIADAVPRDSKVLQHFIVRSSASNIEEETIAALEAKFGPKRGKTRTSIIDLNGFIV